MSKTLNLIEELKQIPDYRKSKGKRHELCVVLFVLLLGCLYGSRSYRPLADLS
ncbi:MAG TPA: transposase family protein [Allocoleopsis sp.]